MCFDVLVDRKYRSSRVECWVHGLIVLVGTHACSCEPFAFGYLDGLLAKSREYFVFIMWSESVVMSFSALSDRAPHIE